MKNRIVSLLLATMLVCAFLQSIALSALASDTSVQMLVEPTMDYFIVGRFSEGLARVEKDGKCGFIDTTGKLVIPLEYDADRYSHFSEGLALVYKGGHYIAASQRIMDGGKCGFIDKAGKVVIPLEYDGATAFSEGLAAVQKDGKRYLINQNGDIIVALNTRYYYEKTGRSYEGLGIYPFSEGMAAVFKDDECGFIDKTGKEVIPVGKYEYAWSPFSEGLAAVRQDDKFGFIDKTGEVVIPFEYDWAYSFSNGLVAVSNGDKCGVINKSGEVVIPFEYDSIGAFSEGLMSFEKDGEQGYMDETGEVMISLDYKRAFVSFSGESLSPFQNGYAIVHGMLDEDPRSDIWEASMDMSSYEKWGVIDKTGKEVIPLEYDYISSFNDGVAVVFVGHADFYHNHFVGNWGILQIEGYVAPPSASPITVPPLSENSTATFLIWLRYGVVLVVVLLLMLLIVRKNENR